MYPPVHMCLLVWPLLWSWSYLNWYNVDFYQYIFSLILFFALNIAKKLSFDIKFGRPIPTYCTPTIINCGFYICTPSLESISLFSRRFFPKVLSLCMVSNQEHTSFYFMIIFNFIHSFKSLFPKNVPKFWCHELNSATFISTK